MADDLTLKEINIFYIKSEIIGYDAITLVIYSFCF